MISYHVFFTPKAGIEDLRVVDTARKFFDELKTERKVRGYRILRVTNAGSFQALPRFQAIVDYDSQEELDASFAFMRTPNKKEDGAHGELMKMVAEFKVSFTSDV